MAVSVPVAVAIPVAVGGGDRSRGRGYGSATVAIPVVIPIPVPVAMAIAVTVPIAVTVAVAVALVDGLDDLSRGGHLQRSGETGAAPVALATAVAVAAAVAVAIPIAVAIAIAVAVAMAIAVAVATARSRGAYRKLLTGRSSAVVSRGSAATRPSAPGGTTLALTCLLAGVTSAVSVSEGRRNDEAGPAERHQQNRSTNQFPEIFRRTGLPEGRSRALRKNAHGSLHFRLSANVRESFSRE